MKTELFQYIGKCDIYPQLFSGQILNYHSNIGSGMLKKKNLYSSLVDVLEGSVPNQPVNKLSLVDGLIDAFEKSGPGQIVLAISKLLERLKAERERLLSIFNELDEKEGVVRAEFRLNHKVLYCILPLLETMFLSKNVIKYTLMIDSKTIATLGKMLLHLITGPIEANLLKIMVSVEVGKLSKMKMYFCTISAFETLFTRTLFSGETHTYLRSMVWATRSSSEGSLDLMKSIQEKNHPVFPTQFFDVNNMELLYVNDSIADEMFQRYGRSISSAIKSLDLISALRKLESSPNLQAKLLWTEYFAELPADDFELSAGVQDRVKILSLKEELRPTRGKSIEEATATVFNRLNFGNPKWKRPYFEAFERWCKDDGSKNLDHQRYLINVAENMLGIELIHDHSEKDRFLARGRKYYDLRKIEIDFRTNNAIIRTGLAISQKIRVEEDLTRERGKRLKFTEFEDVSLVRGYNFFDGKWERMRKCPELKFHISRTGGNLKDRFRSLKKMRRLLLDSESGKFYLANFRTECLLELSRNGTAHQIEAESDDSWNVIELSAPANNASPLPGTANDDDDDDGHSLSSSNRSVATLRSLNGHPPSESLPYDENDHNLSQSSANYSDGSGLIEEDGSLNSPIERSSSDEAELDSSLSSDETVLQADSRTVKEEIIEIISRYYPSSHVERMCSKVLAFSFNCDDGPRKSDLKKTMVGTFCSSESWQACLDELARAGVLGANGAKYYRLR